jgi:hypothetical protein
MPFFIVTAVKTSNLTLHTEDLAHVLSAFIRDWASSIGHFGYMIISCGQEGQKGSGMKENEGKGGV